MAKSQKTPGQCSLAQAALYVWSRLGWKWQAGHALAVSEDSSTRSQCHGGAAGGGGGGGGSGECGWVLRWRRWCLFLFRDLLLLCGWSSECWLVAIWEDASAIGVKVCVSRPCSYSRGRRMVYTVYCLRVTVTTTMLQRDFKQLRERSHSPPAPCAALSTDSSSLLRPPSLRYIISLRLG